MTAPPRRERTASSTSRSCSTPSCTPSATAAWGTAIAHLLLRTRLPGRQWLDWGASAALAIPGIVLAIGFLRAFRGLELPFGGGARTCVGRHFSLLEGDEYVDPLGVTPPPRIEASVALDEEFRRSRGVLLAALDGLAGDGPVRLSRVSGPRARTPERPLLISY